MDNHNPAVLRTNVAKLKESYAQPILEDRALLSIESERTGKKLVFEFLAEDNLYLVYQVSKEGNSKNDYADYQHLLLYISK